MLAMSGGSDGRAKGLVRTGGVRGVRGYAKKYYEGAPLLVVVATEQC